MMMSKINIKLDNTAKGSFSSVNTNLDGIHKINHIGNINQNKNMLTN